MPRRRREAPPAAPIPPVTVPALWSAAVGAAFLLVYLWLAPPVTGDQDSSEFALTLAAGGIPHPTGYPLYAVFGHLFCVCLHALGASWPYAANAWSALGAAVAVGLFHALAARAAPAARAGRWARFAVATLATTLVALNRVWTMVATLAEVHSWHLAWATGIALCFVTTVRGLTRRDPWSDRRLVVAAATWGLVLGVGLAHHPSGVVFASPLVLVAAVVGARARRWRPALVPAALAGALLPLAGYSFLVWRAFHPASFQWPMLEPSLASAVRHALGGAYTHFFGRFAPGELQQEFLAADVYPFLFTGLALLALVAWRSSARPERFVRVGLLGAALLQTVVVFQYGVPDPAAYFLPPLWIATLALPTLVMAAWSHGALRVGLLVASTAGVVALAVPWLHRARERREDFVFVDGHLRSLWRDIPHERAIVLWPNDTYCRFIEFQRFDGEHRERFVINPYHLTEDVPPRRDFIARFGFNPLEGFRPRSFLEFEQLVAESINRRTPLPVVVVDRMGITATTLPKPGR